MMRGGAMREAEGLILGVGLISSGMAVLRDKWKLSGRLVGMHRSFLEMFRVREDVRERMLDDQRILVRLFGGALIAGGVYASLLEFFVWR
jgi:hypothetical protein